MHLGDFIANAIRPGDGYLVDMYAFGVSAFQLVTGTLPYQKEAVMALLAEHSSAPVPDLTLLRPEMPRRFAALVSKLMAKDSDDRPQSMEHVAWELQQIRRERASVTGLRPSSLYALRRSGEDADVKWDQGLVLVRRSRGIKGRVMEMTKTNHDQVIKLPDFVMQVLRWHVDKQLTTREMERSELLFPSELGGFRHNSALAKPFRAIAKLVGVKKKISPKAMRRSFQDAMREAQVANVVVRSISGHLTEQMQQRYSTARGHEQENAIARIIDLTQVHRRLSQSQVDSKVDSTGGQQRVAGDPKLTK